MLESRRVMVAKSHVILRLWPKFDLHFIAQTHCSSRSAIGVIFLFFFFFFFFSKRKQRIVRTPMEPGSRGYQREMNQNPVRARGKNAGTVRVLKASFRNVAVSYCDLRPLTHTAGMIPWAIRGTSSDSMDHSNKSPNPSVLLPPLWL